MCLLSDEAFVLSYLSSDVLGQSLLLFQENEINLFSCVNGVVGHRDTKESFSVASKKWALEKFYKLMKLMLTADYYTLYIRGFVS